MLAFNIKLRMQSVWSMSQMCSAMWFLVISLSTLHLQTKKLMPNSVDCIIILLTRQKIICIPLIRISMRGLENNSRLIPHNNIMMTHTYPFHQGVFCFIALQSRVIAYLAFAKQNKLDTFVQAQLYRLFSSGYPLVSCSWVWPFEIRSGQ